MVDVGTSEVHRVQRAIERRKKIHVLVMPSTYPSSYNDLEGIWVRDQAIALEREGLRVGVVYPEFRSLRTILEPPRNLTALYQTRPYREGNINVVRNHGWNIPRLRLGPALWVTLGRRAVHQYIRKFGVPDVLHAHCVLWAGDLARRTSAELGIPYLVTEHSSAFLRGTIQPWQEPSIRQSITQATAVLAVSSALGQELKKRCPAARVKTFPNMVDATFFTPNERRPPNSQFVFTSISSLDSNKGVDLLIRAFRNFRGEPVRLEIGGSGPDRQRLEDLAAKEQVQDQVTFLGYLTRRDVRDALRRSNALVLSSYRETFGLVVAEAMATGLPVVSTRCGGPEDFVNDETGILAPTGDVIALATAMKQVRDEYRRFDSVKIRDYCVQRFASGKVATDLCDLYSSVLRDESV